MPALLILNYDVTDPEALATHRKAAEEALVGSGRGERFVRTDETVDLREGAAAGTDTEILLFESVEAARAAYESPEHQAVLAERQLATEVRLSAIVPLSR